MKTITLSDEIYEKLVRIKGNKSFNYAINKLISSNIEKRIELLIEAAEESGFENELQDISEKIRKNFMVRV